MVLSKQEIWDRIRVKSVWLYQTRTAFFTDEDEHIDSVTDPITAASVPVVSEEYTRYIISLLFQGNAVQAQSAKIEKYKEDGTYEVKWSDIQIQPAAMPQIPEGAYDIENPIISLEGGSNLYGHVNGNSINLTVTYWDSDV